ncbi:MAG: LysE family transporter, partial [Chloroflexota bacterium]|nr:LysE family transporter [Chloroflexota bacterium]
LTTLTVRETMRRGFWAGPLLALGHGVIELALVVGLALGLSRLLDEDPVMAAIGIAGGLFLIWMGVHIMGSLGEPPPVIGRAPLSEGPGAAAYDGSWRRRFRQRGASLWRIWRGLHTLSAAGPSSGRLPPMAAVLMPAAILVSVSNPGWVAWWASVGTAYVSKSLDQGAAGVASFFGGHILSDIVWLTLLAFLLASGRQIMTGAVYRGILAVCGLFLLGLGAYFLASGLMLVA